jgi:hypothetical protein
VHSRKKFSIRLSFAITINKSQGQTLLRWMRRLFAWEEEQVGELTLLLQNVNLQVDKDDMWHWSLENSRVYSVCSAYQFLTVQHLDTSSVASTSLWNKDIPLKVVLFVWRLF